jgi:cbb3-type cytochrome oxidase subunit 3
MSKQIGEDTKVTLDLKTIGVIVFFIATVVGMWFTLKADIDEAKELPLPPDPEVTRMEYDMKDQLIRQTIMTTQDDVKELKSDMRRIEEKIDKLK